MEDSQQALFAHEDAPQAGQTSVQDLPNDTLTRVLSLLSCLDLARACCICRSWRRLANSEGLWLPLLKIELGLSRKPSWAPSSYTLFRHLVGDPLGVSLSNEARFAAVVGSLKGWLLRLRRHTRTASNQTVEEMYVSPDRVTVNRQSLWIHFTLPDRGHDIAEQPQEHKQWEVSLDALYSDPACDRMSHQELTVISVPDYKWPHSDYQMLMQSHVDGLYSWDEGDGSLKVVAYVHYQHLLPLAQAKIPTPQALRLPRGRRGMQMPSLPAPGAPPDLPPPSRLVLHMDLSQLGGPRARESCLVHLAQPPAHQSGAIPPEAIYSQQDTLSTQEEEVVAWAACPTWQPAPDQQQITQAETASSSRGAYAPSSPGSLPAVCMLPSAEEQQDLAPGSVLADALVQLSSVAAEWRGAAHEAVHRACDQAGPTHLSALQLLQLDLAATDAGAASGAVQLLQAGSSGHTEQSAAVAAAEADVGCDEVLEHLQLGPAPPDPMERLDKVLSREGMMDFALYASDTGQLLLGRCGVETWSHNRTVNIRDQEGHVTAVTPVVNMRSHNMHFLVDGVEQSLWSNQLSVNVVFARVYSPPGAPPACDPQQALTESGHLPAYRPQPVPERLQALSVPPYMEGCRLHMTKASAAAMLQQAE